MAPSRTARPGPAGPGCGAARRSGPASARAATGSGRSADQDQGLGSAPVLLVRPMVVSCSTLSRMPSTSSSSPSTSAEAGRSAVAGGCVVRQPAPAPARPGGPDMVTGTSIRTWSSIWRPHPPPGPVPPSPWPAPTARTARATRRDYLVRSASKAAGPKRSPSVLSRKAGLDVFRPSHPPAGEADLAQRDGRTGLLCELTP